MLYPLSYRGKLYMSPPPGGELVPLKHSGSLGVPQGAGTPFGHAFGWSSLYP